MWVCAECGEQDNEDSFNYCFSCGAGMPGHQQPPRTAEFSPIGATTTNYPEAEETNEFRSAAYASEKSLATQDKAVRQTPVPPAVARGERLISVRLSPEAQEAIELLLRAERFDTPEAAAEFLIVKGVESQSEFLYLLWQKLKEIDRLRDELRRIGG
jgi:hypothetical protein